MKFISEKCSVMTTASHLGWKRKNDFARKVMSGDVVLNVPSELYLFLCLLSWFWLFTIVSTVPCSAGAVTI